MMFYKFIINYNFCNNYSLHITHYLYFRSEKSLSIFINYACCFVKIFCAWQTFPFPFKPIFLWIVNLQFYFVVNFLKFTCRVKLTIHLFTFLYSIRESNPCFLLERQASWTIRRIERFSCDFSIVNLRCSQFLKFSCVAKFTIHHSLLWPLTRSRTWTTRVHFLHAAITLSAVLVEVVGFEPTQQWSNRFTVCPDSPTSAYFLF